MHKPYLLNRAFEIKVLEHKQYLELCRIYKSPLDKYRPEWIKPRSMKINLLQYHHNQFYFYGFEAPVLGLPTTITKDKILDVESAIRIFGSAEFNQLPVIRLFMVTCRLVALEETLFKGERLVDYFDTDELYERQKGWGPYIRLRRDHHGPTMDLLDGFTIASGLTTHRVAKQIARRVGDFAQASALVKYPEILQHLIWMSRLLPNHTESDYRNELWGLKVSFTPPKAYPIKIDIEGQQTPHVACIHSHSLNSFAEGDVYKYIPPTIMGSVDRYYKRILADYILVYKNNLINQPEYLSISSHGESGVIKPIGDVYALIKEGDQMRHCIGGVGYQRGCAGRGAIAFHYIPNGCDDKDVTTHYTGFLVRIDAKGVTRWHLHEFQGYANAAPPDHVMDTVLSMLKSVQIYLKDECIGTLSVETHSPAVQV